MSIQFKRIKEVLKPKSYKDFLKFMEGQTVDERGVFEDDFLKWINEQEVTD